MRRHKTSAVGYLQERVKFFNKKKQPEKKTFQKFKQRKTKTKKTGILRRLSDSALLHMSGRTVLSIETTWSLVLEPKSKNPQIIVLIQ